MIEVSNLVKFYGDKRALGGISFTVNQGEILGFLGPNGAGKTTTMNIITGYLSATSGKVTINGYDILEQPELAKKNIGYLPELPPLFLDMTVYEYLEYVSELKKVSRDVRKKQIANVMQMVHM
jgi:ABC-2 type transport system ATP-binding protein